MMQATENRACRHMLMRWQPMAMSLQWRREGGKRLWHARSEGHMRTLGIRMRDPFVYDAAQVVLSQRDNQIQAFPPQRADEPFAQGVRLRTVRRRFHDP